MVFGYIGISVFDKFKSNIIIKEKTGYFKKCKIWMTRTIVKQVRVN